MKKVKAIKETSLAVTQEMLPQNLIAQAITQGANVEIMEKLMDLQDRWDVKQAKKAFDAAMSDFQSECPVIKKAKDGGRTNAGVVAYKFAPMDAIVSQTKELIAKHGFSYRIITGTRDKMLFADCIVKHKLGHTETTPFEVPPQTGTNVMSAPQVQAAALTFAKRYAFLNAFGIMTGDDDTDAKKVTSVEVKTVKVLPDIEGYRAKLESVTSATELLSVWSKLPAEVKKEVLNTKNDLKKKFNIK